MESVWLVSKVEDDACCGFEYYESEGVFSTKELAVEYIAKEDEFWSSRRQYYKWELREMKLDGKEVTKTATVPSAYRDFAAGIMAIGLITQLVLPDKKKKE